MSTQSETGGDAGGAAGGAAHTEAVGGAAHTEAVGGAAHTEAAHTEASSLMGGVGGEGGKFDKMANMMSGGMPCQYELPMEFFTGFIFTFLIYFLVFGFVPYEDIVSTMTKYVIEFPQKMYNSFLGKMPSSVKNSKSGSIGSTINKLLSETIPKMIEKEKNKLMTPLQKKLEVLKKKENSQNKSGSPNFFTEYMTKVKTQGMAIFEKFKHNIIPAIFISIIYYITWYVIFKIIPGILKYGINMAMSFK